MRLIRTLLWIAFIATFVYLADLPYVPALRRKNPTHTALMDLRIEQAHRARKHLKTVMVWRDVGAISPHLRRAVLLAEDDTFYQHRGFDFQEILVAIKMDWDKGRFAYGGSTITQQLARTLYLSPRKNLLRKLKEAEITLWMEHVLTKRRILELYLNVAEWGPGIYGAEAAARYYFHTSAQALTPDQAIALASILPSPRRWSPFSEHVFMARRRTRLFEEMQQAGYLPVAISTETAPTVPTEAPPFE